MKSTVESRKIDISLKVLLIENSATDAKEIEARLMTVFGRQELTISVANSLSQLTLLLSQETFDLIILELALPDSCGLETLVRVQALAFQIPAIVYTALECESVALEAIQMGAQDYLIKGQCDETSLRRSLLYAISRQTRELKANEEKFHQFDRLLTQLQKSEARNQALLNAIPDMMFRCQADGTFLDFKPAKEMESLIPPELFIGKKPQDVLPEFLADQVMHFNELALKTGKIQFFEYQLPMGDRLRDYEARIVACGNDEIISMIRDISEWQTALRERQQAEAALRENQHFIQQITDFSPSILYVYDLIEKRNIYMNRDITTGLGYEPAEIQAMGSAVLPILIHPEDWNLYLEHLKQVENVKDTCIFQLEYRMQHKSGSWRWFNSREVVFTRTPEGRPQQILGTATDITEIKQKAEAIAKSARQSALRSDISVALAKGGDLSEMLTQCVQVLAEHTNVPIARIWTLNLDESILELQAFTGSPPLTEDAYRVPVGHFVVGRMVIERQPFLTNEIQDDSSLHPVWVREAGMVALAGYPLIVEDQLIGVMTLLAPEPLSPEILDSLALIANEIAVGIERKRAAIALELSQQQLTMALAASSLGIWDCHIATKQVYFSPEWKAMLGYGIDELENRWDTWQQLMHPEDWPNTLNLLDAYLQGKIPVYKVEFRLQHRSGEWRWIQAYGKVFEWDELGNPLRLTGTHQDITERKQVELELLRFRLAVDSTSDAIAIADLRGTHCYQNRAFKDLYGYATAEEFQTAGGPTAAFVNPELGKEVLETIMNGQSWVGEVEHVSRTGHRMQILMRANPIQDNNGQLVGLLSINTDISDRKQVEEEKTQLIASLQKLATQFNEAQKIAHIGNWEFEIATHHNSWSEELFRIYDRQPGAIPTFEETLAQVHPDDRDLLQQQVQRSLQEGQPYDIDYRLYRSSGEICHLNARGQGIRDESGKVVRLFGTVMDITERKKSEARERLKAAELEAALYQLKSTQAQLVQQEKMAGLGQLVAGVAHEINNPVNFIYGNINHAQQYVSDLLGLLDLYQQFYPTPVPEIAEEIEALELDFLKEDFQRLLTSMTEGANRIKEIVLSLRNFSRLDEAEKKEADIHLGIDSTLMILQHRLKEQPRRKAIRLVKDYGDLPLLECYPGQLNQVFMNILANAIDALEDKLKLQPDFTPQITIQTQLKPALRTVTSQSTKLSQSPQVIISIADNGLGMKPEIKERIFNPFFTTKPVGSGTGLGLSISYQIVVEKHQGKIRCKSQRDRGTEFIIQLPVAAVALD